MEEKNLPLIKEERLRRDDKNNPKNINIQEVLTKKRLELFERLNKGTETKKSED